MVCILKLVIEANRTWFVRLKEYLIDRFHKAKTTEQGLSSIPVVFQIDLPVAPEIEVNAISEFSAEIIIVNSEINKCSDKERLFVVRYKSLPDVVLGVVHSLDTSFLRTGSTCTCSL